MQERRTKHVGIVTQARNLETGIKLPDGSLVVPVKSSVAKSSMAFGCFQLGRSYVNLAKPLFSKATRFDTW